MFEKKAEKYAVPFKAVMFGTPGSGKTYTASLIAIGLHKYYKKTTPIAFLDTEPPGHRHVVELFEKAGIELRPEIDRTVKALSQAMEMAEKEKMILIVDSLTHIWDRFLLDYKVSRKKERNNLTILDWSIVKDSWNQLVTEPMKKLQAHFIFCGRSGDVFEYQTNEDTGKKEMIITGSKMRTEKNLPYEVDLTIELEQIDNPKGPGKIHTATILKDRSDVIDGKVFQDLKFENLLPFVQKLSGEPVTTSSQVSLGGANEFPYVEGSTDQYRRKVIVLEEMESMLTKMYPSPQSKDDKLGRIAMCEKIFGTSSKTAIEEMPLEKLQACREMLRAEAVKAGVVEGTPTPAVPVATQITPEQASQVIVDTFAKESSPTPAPEPPKPDDPKPEDKLQSQITEHLNLLPANKQRVFINSVEKQLKKKMRIMNVDELKIVLASIKAVIEGEKNVK